MGLMLAMGVAAFASWGLTAMVRRYALRRALIDVPNSRSSHTAPTPRGGGLAIVIVVLSAVAGLAWLGLIPPEVALALGGGGLLVSGIGWMDDHRHVAPPWRLLVQTTAAAWALYWLGGMESIVLLGEALAVPGWAETLVALVAIVWLTNLYNFMDGIDGLAGSQAVTVAGTMGVLFMFSGVAGLACLAWLIVAVAVGYLLWNWPPAKIFMGDVGSGLLGFVFAVLAIAGEKAADIPALLWLIPLAIFVYDATFTLLLRLYRRERWYAAHRRHAYQRLIQLGWSHGRVTGYAVIANVVVLAPLSWFAWRYPQYLIGFLIVLTCMMWGVWQVIQSRAANQCGNDEHPSQAL